MTWTNQTHRDFGEKVKDLIGILEIRRETMTDFEKKNLWNSIATIRWFIEEQCEEHRTASMVVKEDKTELSTDWGYFEEGLDEIENWLDKRDKVTKNE